MYLQSYSHATIAKAKPGLPVTLTYIICYCMTLFWWKYCKLSQISAAPLLAAENHQIDEDL